MAMNQCGITELVKVLKCKPQYLGEEYFKYLELPQSSFTAKVLKVVEQSLET